MVSNLKIYYKGTTRHLVILLLVLGYVTNVINDTLSRQTTVFLEIRFLMDMHSVQDGRLHPALSILPHLFCSDRDLPVRPRRPGKIWPFSPVAVGEGIE